MEPNKKKWDENTQGHVTALLSALKKNEDCKSSEAYYLHFKARHFLACNEVEKAQKYFDKALQVSLENNHGRLTGEIALNTFACMLSKNKFIAKNHERYYRYFMDYPVVEFPSGNIDVVAE